MALAATVAAVAGTTALAGYIDAKYSIRKDLTGLYRLSWASKAYAKAVKEDRVCLWYLFAEAAAKYPDALCIWSREGNYTWKEVHDQSCRYAQYLISLDVKPGQLVAVYMTNCPEFMFVWLACWALGCAPAMVNYNLTGDALVHCLKVSAAPVLLVDKDGSCQERIEESRERIGDLGMTYVALIPEKQQEITSLPPNVPEDKWRAGMKGSFPMELIYTSGTTGLPKGCAFTTDRFWLLGAQKAWSFSQKAGPDGDCWYNCMPMYHGTGGISAIACLVAGVSLAIGKKFSTSNFWKDLHDSESTFFVYVGEIARYLLAAPPGPYDRDHKVRCMYGNGLRPDVWQRFQERFNIPEVAEFFNSTEGLLALLNWDRGDYLATAQGHHGLIARTLMHNVYIPVAIDHETGDIWRDPVTGLAKRTKYTEGGEILVKIEDEAVFQGYWRSPEATKKKYARDVFKKGDLYYRSGDALCRTDDGRWFFLDRLGDTFRWKSENVSTAEVAEALGKYSGVIDANVYGVLVPKHDGRAGCAAILVEKSTNGSFDYHGLLKHAGKYLPRYAVPVFIRVVKASSIIHNNKQNKVPLRAEGVDPDAIGTKEPAGKNDTFLWIPPKGNAYVDFGRADWEALKSGEARL